MQTAVMLLRSSSSPLVVDCLAAPANSSPEETLQRSRGGKFLSSACSHPLLHLDFDIASARLSEPRAPSSETLGSGFLREVLSETNLCGLGGAAGCGRPAQVAANTLLQGALTGESPSSSTTEASWRGCPLLSVRKRGSLLPLCRQMSLCSLPSELPSVCFHGGSVGNDRTVLEESESLSSCSPCASDLETTSSGFEKIALPVHDFVQGRLLPDIDEEDPSCMRSCMSMLENEIVRGMGGCCRPTGTDQMDMVVSSTGSGDRPRLVSGGGGGGDAGGDGGSSSGIAEQHYKQMLEMDPGNPLFLRNYAQYLSDVKHEYGKAEEFYQRAVLASPDDGELLGQYAELLWEVRHDAKRAATYFERAIQAAPDNSYVMAAYASFLWSSDEDEQELQECGGLSARGSSPLEGSGSFPSLVSAGFA